MEYLLEITPLAKRWAHTQAVGMRVKALLCILLHSCIYSQCRQGLGCVLAVMSVVAVGLCLWCPLHAA